MLRPRSIALNNLYFQNNDFILNIHLNLYFTSLSPDKTSNNASSFVPSLRSSIKSSIFSGGILYNTTMILKNTIEYTLL